MAQNLFLQYPALGRAAARTAGTADLSQDAIGRRVFRVNERPKRRTKTLMQFRALEVLGQPVPEGANPNLVRALLKRLGAPRRVF